VIPNLSSRPRLPRWPNSPARPRRAGTTCSTGCACCSSRARTAQGRHPDKPLQRLHPRDQPQQLRRDPSGLATPAGGLPSRRRPAPVLQARCPGPFQTLRRPRPRALPAVHSAPAVRHGGRPARLPCASALGSAARSGVGRRERITALRHTGYIARRGTLPLGSGFVVRHPDPIAYEHHAPFPVLTLPATTA
jgi:hypothetical protein